MERFGAYDWHKCLHLDMVHFFGMCRHLKAHPVPDVRWVEYEDSGPDYEEAVSYIEDNDLPPPADQPQSVTELAAWLNRG